MFLWQICAVWAVGRVLQDLGRVLQKKWAEFSNGPGSPGPGSPAGRVHLIPTEIIELSNASNKSTHVLCIGRKLRSFWVEHLTCICIISVGVPERVTVFQNVLSISWAIWYINFTTCFYFAVHQGTHICNPIIDREFRMHVDVVRTHVRLQRRCLSIGNSKCLRTVGCSRQFWRSHISPNLGINCKQ